MANRIIQLEVTYQYTLHVDDSNPIVKEYDNDKDLFDDLASYRFDILPVIGDGVEIKDVELLDWNKI